MIAPAEQKYLDKKLIKAAENGDTNQVGKLLDRGADIHADNDEAFRGSAQNHRTKTTELLLRHCNTSELWVLKSMDPILLGTKELLPLVRMEIARRLVQKALTDQPALDV